MNTISTIMRTTFKSEKRDKVNCVLIFDRNISLTTTRKQLTYQTVTFIKPMMDMFFDYSE